jgi:hypothetical protein
LFWWALLFDPTVEYCAVPSGDITSGLRMAGGTAQYLVGASIMAVNKNMMAAV